MNRRTTARGATPFPTTRPSAMAAVLGLLLCLSPRAAGLSGPPDRVVPCLPCHNRPASNPVGEWLASPYSQVEGGRGCADCHGPRCSGNSDAGVRDDVTNPRAGVPGAAAQLAVAAVCNDDSVEAEVLVANLGAGHDLPTGPPERTLVLEVTARGQDGLPLPPRLGDGRPAAAAATASPGRIFVKHLPAARSENTRSRLVPFETDVSRYRFVSPARGSARVTARLLLVSVSGRSFEIASTTGTCHPSSATP